MINLKINEQQILKTAIRCKERGITLPTFAEMKNPELISQEIKNKLSSIGLWDVHPANLFRVTWKNETKKTGGGFGKVNFLEIPQELTGVKARIIGLVGKWFPTGAHKVGATYGCLAPALVTGQFNPVEEKAVWPSTGNYCRGGAYISALLACESIAILPQEMSRERFEWLAKVAGEVIATPGCESNVKEIFDKCWELKRTRKDVKIFNQFEEFGNHLWHYEVTGNAIKEIIETKSIEAGNVCGFVSSSGSAGTLGCGDFLKEHYPQIKIVAAEALQCPTLLNNGFGGHRIEGIGDKHIPWIHNLRNTNMIAAVDDETTVRSLRLLNEENGRKLLSESGLADELTNKFSWLGISSVANVVAAVKMAKYYELNENDVIFTVFTDSMELYSSRLKELDEEKGKYSAKDAIRDLEMWQQIKTDNLLELSCTDRKRIHNLKYYTWIEQQEKELSELNNQWYDRNYWKNIHQLVPVIDELIISFNKKILES